MKDRRTEWTWRLVAATGLVPLVAAVGIGGGSDTVSEGDGIWIGSVGGMSVQEALIGQVAADPASADDVIAYLRAARPDGVNVAETVATITELTADPALRAEVSADLAARYGYTSRPAD